MQRIHPVKQHHVAGFTVKSKGESTDVSTQTNKSTLQKKYKHHSTVISPHNAITHLSISHNFNLLQSQTLLLHHARFPKQLIARQAKISLCFSFSSEIKLVQNFRKVLYILALDKSLKHNDEMDCYLTTLSVSVRISMI